MGSKLKGKRYEEILGSERSEQLKETRRKDGLNQYYNTVMERLNEMNLELLDNEYKGIKHPHNFRCKTCGNEFVSKYVTLKRRRIICNVCDNENPNQVK